MEWEGAQTDKVQNVAEYFSNFLFQEEMIGCRKKFRDYRYYVERFFEKIEGLKDLEGIEKCLKKYLPPGLALTIFNICRSRLKTF